LVFFCLLNIILKKLRLAVGNTTINKTLITYFFAVYHAYFLHCYVSDVASTAVFLGSVALCGTYHVALRVGVVVHRSLGSLVLQLPTSLLSLSLPFSFLFLARVAGQLFSKVRSWPSLLFPLLEMQEKRKHFPRPTAFFLLAFSAFGCFSPLSMWVACCFLTVFSPPSQAFPAVHSCECDCVR